MKEQKFIHTIDIFTLQDNPNAPVEPSHVSFRQEVSVLTADDVKAGKSVEPLPEGSMSAKLCTRLILTAWLTSVGALAQGVCAPPVANTDTLMWPGEASIIEVLSNDYDPAGRPLAVASVSPGSGGTVEKTSQGVLFTPAQGATSGSFSYEVRNSDGQTAVATVILSDDPVIVVPPPPPPVPPLNFEVTCAQKNRWCSFKSLPFRHDGISGRGWRFFEGGPGGREIPNCRTDRWPSPNYLCQFPSAGPVHVIHTLFYYDGYVDTMGKGIMVEDVYQTNWTVATEGYGVTNGLQVNVHIQSSTDGMLDATLLINWGDGQEYVAPAHSTSGSYDNTRHYHTYADAGRYRVAMYRNRAGTTSRDPLGHYDIDVVNKKPVVTLAAMNSSDNEVVDLAWDVIDDHRPFNDAVSGDPTAPVVNPLGPSKYEWDFGDGTTATMVLDPTMVGHQIWPHSYPNKLGTYIARLKVTDRQGAVGEGTTVVEITDPAPEPKVSISCQGRDCIVDASESVAERPLVNYAFSMNRLTPSTYSLSSNQTGPIWKVTVPEASGTWSVSATARTATRSGAVTRYFSPREALPGTVFYALNPCTLGSVTVTAEQWGGLQARGRCGIANDANVLYAAVNVKLSGAAYSGSLRIETDPATAILTINPARTVQSAFAVIPLNAAGALQVMMKQFGPAGATATLSMDVVGYFLRVDHAPPPPGTGVAVGPLWYRPVDPCVLFDTRKEPPGLSATAVRTFNMQRRCGLTSKDVALALQASVIMPSTDGTAVAYAPNAALPTTHAFIHALAGRNQATALFSKTFDEQLKVETSMGSAHVTLSTPGAFTVNPGLRFHATQPCRVLDTRLNHPGKSRMVHNEALSFRVRGDCGISPHAKAVLVTATVVNPDSIGHLKLGAAGADAPAYAAVNYLAGETVGAAVVVPVGAGAEDVAALLASISGGGSDLIVDTYGYFDDRKNVAAAANGGSAYAQSTLSSAYPAAAMIDGDRRALTWGAGGGWADGTPDAFPDFVEIHFAGEKLIDEVDLFTLPDTISSKDPTTADRFTKRGVTSYSIGYFDRARGQFIYPVNVTGNDRVWSRATFTPPVRTNKLSIVSRGAIDGHSRIAEVEAYEVPGSGRTNFAAAANGGTIFVSSSADPVKYPASSVNDGDRRGTGWGSGTGGWVDGTFNVFPDHLQVQFNGPKTIDTIDLFTLQDNDATPTEPTDSTSFSKQGVADFTVQYRDPSTGGWVYVASVVNNNRVWRRITLPEPVRTDMVWISLNRGLNYHSRVVELEVWGRDSYGSASAASAPGVEAQH